jgi:peroxiredoxin
VVTRPPVRPGEPAPDFTLPAVLEPGEVSLAAQYERGAVLLALFRGLHCPFCRRQIFQLSGLQETLQRLGVTTLAVVNTPRERAALYFGYHPTRVRLLADPDAHTHRLFGVPAVVLDEAFAAARINPTGELPDALHPMEANTVLNGKDGFVPTAVDEEVFARHGAQLGGHFLIDRRGIVRWSSIEAEAGVHAIASFPAPAEILAATRTLEP